MDIKYDMETRRFEAQNIVSENELLQTRDPVRILVRARVQIVEDMIEEAIREIASQSGLEGYYEISKPAIKQLLIKATPRKTDDSVCPSCPYCRTALRIPLNLEKPYYCRDCGQRIDWSE